MLAAEADSAAFFVERADLDAQLLGSSVSNGSEAGFRDADSALVNVTSVTGKKYTARILLDNGSTVNFVTQNFGEKLDLSLRGMSTKLATSSLVYLSTALVNVTSATGKKYTARLLQLDSGSTADFVLQSACTKDKTAPPLLWSLGRVIKTYPGVDGVTRVAELKTKKGTIRRAFDSICPLPIDD